MMRLVSFTWIAQNLARRLAKLMQPIQFRYSVGIYTLMIRALYYYFIFSPSLVVVQNISICAKTFGEI
jgi:hypothetical protein